jgi:hypothetical protein
MFGLRVWQQIVIAVVLLPYRAGIDKLAAGVAVSFFAPDEFGREVRFAIDTYAPERARALTELLEATESGEPG